MSQRGISTGLMMVGLWLGTAAAQDAAGTPAKPRFPFTATGADYLQETITLNTATRAPWPIFARTAAAQKQPVVFDITTERVVKPSSMGAPPRGYAQVVLKVKLGDQPPFEISAFAETPYVVAMTATNKLTAYEVGFCQAENEALVALMPYACARLIRLSNDAAQTQALLQMIERRWPEEISLQLLRGLGPPANAWSDRAAALLESQVKEKQDPDNVLVVLLAVDEKRGLDALASLAENLNDEALRHVVRQHFELERTARDVRTLSTFPPFPPPKPAELSPAAVATLTGWVQRAPAAAVVCARILLGFGDDVRAAALVRTLPELAPEQAAEIGEMLADSERWKQERLENEKRQRERAEEEKLNQQFPEEEKSKEKAGGN